MAAAGSKKWAFRVTAVVSLLLFGFFLWRYFGLARDILNVIGALVSIASFVISLARGRVREVGPIRREWCACLWPPMHSVCGTRVVDSGARCGQAVRGGSGSESWEALLYGPHEVLPMAGTYEARFYLRRDASNSEPSGDVTLDVYVTATEERLAQRQLRGREIPPDYSSITLPFKYTDSSVTLEFRVKVRGIDLQVSVDRVVVRRIGN